MTVAVNGAGTLELAGSISALSSGSNRVNIVNSSSAPGVLITGTNQIVGAIDGLGNTQVNAGSDLIANHIIQSSLIIGGTAGSHGLVTIDASDASGNPLITSPASLHSELSSSSSSGAFGTGVSNSASLSRIADTDLAVVLLGNSLGGDNAAPVPEPSTLLLVFVAITALVGQGIALRRRARRNDY